MNVKESIINLLNKKEYSKTLFPYVGLVSEEERYDIPEGVSPTAHLPKIFYPIWKTICSSREGFSEYAESVGLGMFNLAGKYIKEEENWKTLSSGAVFQSGGLTVVHNLSVHPTSEPTIKLSISFCDISFELFCTRWDMSYRPWEFMQCSFTLRANKYAFDEKGFLYIKESFNICEHYLTYSGEAYIGKKIPSGSYCVEISEDKFQRNFDMQVMTDWWPFMKKFDEIFILPMKDFLDRDIILMK